MELKQYQQTVLETLDVYLDELRTQLSKAAKVRKLLKDDFEPEMVDFPQLAWKHLKDQGRLPKFRASVPHSGRKDGMGNDVPNICLKIPTGGGKTVLAANAVSRIMGRYLQRNYGLVLWIVPNEAIYSQTKKQLTNR